MPTGPADMLVHVNCSGIRPRRRWALRTRGGRQLRLQFETSRPQCLSCSQPTPGASGRQNSYNRCAGMAVTPSVLCKTSSRIRSTTPPRSNGPTASGALLHERVDPERLHAWHGCSHLQRRLSVSVPPRRGFKLNMVTGVVIGALVGSRNNLVPSMPVIDLQRPTSTCCSSARWPYCHRSYAPTINCHSCRGGCFIQQNHLYFVIHTTANPRRPGTASLWRRRDGTGVTTWVKTKICRSASIGSEDEIQNNWWTWAGFGLVWVG